MRDEYLFKKYGVQDAVYILDDVNDIRSIYEEVRSIYEEEGYSFPFPFDSKWTVWVELSWGNGIASNSFGASLKEAIENCILILLTSSLPEVKEIVSKYSLKNAPPFDTFEAIRIRESN